MNCVLDKGWDILYTKVVTFYLLSKEFFTARYGINKRSKI